MKTELRYLHAGEMDALSRLLNTAFTGNPDSRHFEDGLPKMWVDDDAHMSRHIAVFEDGVMAGAVGIYPYDVNIGAKTLRFATVGNIGVLSEYRGRGYMKLLMDAAMDELGQQKIDVSRLGGLRTRYEHYGYEMCGTNCSIRLSKRNAEEAYPDGSDITFHPITADDTAALAFVRQIYNACSVACDRGDDRDLYKTLCAWKNKPYLAYKNDTLIGYLCASPDGTSLAEHGAMDAPLHTEMLCAWVRGMDAYEVRAEVYPWDAALCRSVMAICETFTASPATQCKILSWDRFTDALLSLKAQSVPLIHGSVTLGIDGWGTLVMEVDSDGARAYRGSAEVPTADTPDVLTAARMLFGTVPPNLCAPLSEHTNRLLSAWLPLPFSWNGQDRV